MSPAARSLAAAYQLAKEGRPVSLNAACRLAGVDRKHLRRKYPEAVAAIRGLARPDRTPSRGTVDRRTGRLDAVDDDED